MSATDPYADIRARLAAATPGPWEAVTSGRGSGDHWYVCADGESLAHIHANDGTDEDAREPDAKFIAHSRTDLPRLLADIDHVRITAAENQTGWAGAEHRLSGAHAAIQRVRELHARRPWQAADLIAHAQAEFPDLCDHCHNPHPCPTIRALDGDTGSGDHDA